ncbi:hypothetical protein, partial [Thermomonas sp.]|uniref:hypothetical protein n=1 Tax=Thermomonas sp. TaxID=1971895 RepID=UPI002488E590
MQARFQFFSRFTGIHAGSSARSASCLTDIWPEGRADARPSISAGALNLRASLDDLGDHAGADGTATFAD